jgi:hypothetical protein
MSKKAVFHQRRIPGMKRVPGHAAQHPKVEAAIAFTARKYNVSKSWVRATALAHYFNIREQEDFKKAGV